jgi:phosphoribosylformylglycinamidine synthase
VKKRDTMNTNVKRIYVEKKKGFDIEANSLLRDLKHSLGIHGLQSVRIINRYDIEGIVEAEYQLSKFTIFAESPVDLVYDEEIDTGHNIRLIAVELLPGQYDQRADSAAQCVQILTQRERPKIKVAKLIMLEGGISDAEYRSIKEYCINPLESQEASLVKPSTLDLKLESPEDVEIMKGFITVSSQDLLTIKDELGLAMSAEDLEFCRAYFRDTEHRDPTLTEIRVLDTYWSDHCRHTTFLTGIESVTIEAGAYSNILSTVYQNYLESRRNLYRDRDKECCLMDLATIAAKELKKKGLLINLDLSEEINACSIQADVNVGGEQQAWLVQFKNETHNHPTEIEPYGGAATCLGGAIRDPLSGRAYVYQAMRVTGSGDPRVPVQETISGKLPQRKITTTAAAGFSSYGNQIGLATGQVAEVYDEGFIAKRMEIGAVIGAVPQQNVVREKPNAGDVIILLGGRTGRDGCGGATGSSKAHTEESLLTCGAEVQKGNPPTERKIQRLFRNPSVSRMIKKCNDFGAGGVSVAIGELAEGLEINLDAVPKKYEGLDGTELAISESQERMAVVVARENAAAFCEAAGGENLEATQVAEVTDDARLKMFWRGKEIVNISRAFLDTNGARQTADVKITLPDPAVRFFRSVSPEITPLPRELDQAWLKNLQQLNVCSQKGLVERFDSSIGAGTVLMPFGGLYQSTPLESMAAKIPVLDGETTTGTLMSYGYNPLIGQWSPFHGAVYAIIEAVAKIVATGGNYRGIYLTLQEYFPRLGQDPVQWGKPFSALLGAYYTQMKLGIGAIGGKDSMSGTFKQLSVPPTVVAFAVNVVEVDRIISPEFKSAGNSVVLVPVMRDRDELPDFNVLQSNYERIHQLIQQGKILAAQSVRGGGMAEAVSKMCFGNRIGFAFGNPMDTISLFKPDYGSILLEIAPAEEPAALFEGLSWELLGVTIPEALIRVNNWIIKLEKALAAWEEPLEKIFPTRTETNPEPLKQYRFERKDAAKPKFNLAKPRIFMPVFPGTNCEYDSAKAFEKAGGLVETLVFRNLIPQEIEAVLKLMVQKIDQSQIIMFPGGFSAGDEPDGSGKFIATVFRNPYIKDAVMRLLKERDGLILGICNGFQALIKLGLVPYGEILETNEASPTLTFNTIGRHVSCMVRTKVVSNLSPWLHHTALGDIHTVAISHGEGRFVANPRELEKMAQNGQIATQYVDLNGDPTSDIHFNPNGSFQAIEGITSPDGRVFGKMGHSERAGTYVARNIPGEKEQQIFASGVGYFK